MSRARYLVGIDLGTTHCCLAYALLTEPQQVSLFPIWQLVGPGQVAQKNLLPSVRYHPSLEERQSQDYVLPWEPSPVEGDKAQAWIGEYARWLGGQKLGRTVSSAKSWLSHAKVDRTAPILPWSEQETGSIEKVSPIVASASYLRYLAQCWDHSFPDAPLCEQNVVVTLPASFDDMARVMTRQACRLAGLSAVDVLEEPTAACYQWYQSVQLKETSISESVSRILVCDVGGGTTDFSLVEVSAFSPMLELKRVAVGEHLMLGGDNMDLALAGIVQRELGQEAKHFSASQLTQLVTKTRQAKETLLSDEAPSLFEVTVLGKGSGLMSSAKTVVLSPEQVRQVVLEGYFPLVEYGAQLERSSSAVLAFGLPYAKDPAITRHLAAFLRKHVGQDPQLLPDAVLFNGGVFSAQIVRQRVVDQLALWRGSSVEILENIEPNFAVARGAVAYAAALEGASGKILATLPRHYFLLTDGLENKGICLLPKGSQTHERHQLGQQFALRVGEPVQMHVVASTDARAYVVGEVVDLAGLEVHPLPPLTTTLDSQQTSVEEVPVMLCAMATELGTLELSCQAVDDPEGLRWQFEFEFVSNKTLAKPALETDSALPISDLSSSQKEAVESAIESVFGKADAKAAKANPPGKLKNTLEKCLGERDSWDVSLSRWIVDCLLSQVKRRRRSAQHERVWFWLVGYCIRPGFGAPNDPARVQQIWSLFRAGLQYETESQNQSQWWLMWRRLCGGLGFDEQLQLVDCVQKLLKELASGKKKKLNARAEALIKAKQAGQMDAIRLLGLCERLETSRRQALGDQLLTMLCKDLNNESLWWSLGRIGARVPVYEETGETVLEPTVIEAWLEIIFKLLDSGRQFPLETAAFALTQMSLRVLDDQYNLSDTWVEVIVRWLEVQKMPQRWIESITEVHTQDVLDQSRRLGEQLPHGLRLLHA